MQALRLQLTLRPTPRRPRLPGGGGSSGCVRSSVTCASLSPCTELPRCTTLRPGPHERARRSSAESSQSSPKPSRRSRIGSAPCRLRSRSSGRSAVRPRRRPGRPLRCRHGLRHCPHRRAHPEHDQQTSIVTVLRPRRVRGLLAVHCLRTARAQPPVRLESAVPESVHAIWPQALPPAPRASAAPTSGRAIGGCGPPAPRTRRLRPPLRLRPPSRAHRVQLPMP